ncbi:MAG: COG1470 family protein [Thermoguttaceae bacterium]
MMDAVWALLIVAIRADAPSGGRYPGATEVFHCDFSESWDRDFNGWPDRWTRQQGPGFPHYVKISVCSAPGLAGHGALRMEMDGGAAAAYAPPVPASPLYDYVLDGLVNTEGLEHDHVYLSLTVLDDRHRPVETFASERLGRAPAWRRLRLGPISPSSPAGRWVAIGVHVEPGSRADLQGTALFGDLWLGRLPRIALAATNPSGLYTDPKQVAITCRVSGFSRPDAAVDLELCDVFGLRLAETEQPLRAQPVYSEAALRPAAMEGEAACLIGSAQWQPPVAGPGFYRLRAGVKADQQMQHRREITVAVIAPGSPRADSEFGWSLGPTGCPLAPAELEELISQAGIRWLKYPLWHDPKADPKQARALAELLDRLGSRQVRVVGVLDRRFAAETRGQQDPPEWSGSMAGWLSRDPKTWKPALQATVTMLGSQIQWWQLGPDGDTGFVGYPHLEQKLAEISQAMLQPGQEVRLGAGWGWMDPLPEIAAGRPPLLRFVVLSGQPPLTHEELASYLGAGASPEIARWVLLEPLRGDQYRLEDRAADLVQRIVAAKLGRADAILLADPFRAEYGVINADGMPGELFLPWRTAALVLGGAEPAGSMTLGQGSPNRVFLRASDAVMVVWNPVPTRETLQPGPEARQLDLWGRETVCWRGESGLEIAVGPLPSFVVRMNRQIVEWELGFGVSGQRLPAVFGRRHPIEVHWKNSFPGGVDGTLSLAAPEGWTVEPPQVAFRLGPGQTARQVFQVSLPVDAQSGQHLLGADFEIRADRTYRFSVHRPIHVGIEQLRIEIDTQLMADGQLEVQQQLINDSDRVVNLRCHLLAPDRRRSTVQVVGLGRGRDVQTHRLPDGKSLLGKTLWLQVQQADGPEVLNYRFVAGQ